MLGHACRTTCVFQVVFLERSDQVFAEGCMDLELHSANNCEDSDGAALKRCRPLPDSVALGKERSVVTRL